MNFHYKKYIGLDNYKIRFSIKGLIIYWLLLVPNIIWQLFPPINNVLLSSATSYPILDGVEWFFRTLILLILIFLVNKELSKNKTSYKWVAISFLAIYYVSWILYYLGIVNPWLIILGMVITPTFYFFFSGIWLRNYILLIPTVIFGIFHFIISILNYL